MLWSKKKVWKNTRAGKGHWPQTNQAHPNIDQIHAFLMAGVDSLCQFVLWWITIIKSPIIFKIWSWVLAPNLVTYVVWTLKKLQLLSDFIFLKLFRETSIWFKTILWPVRLALSLTLSPRTLLETIGKPQIFRLIVWWGRIESRWS